MVERVSQLQKIVVEMRDGIRPYNAEVISAIAAFMNRLPLSNKGTEPRHTVSPLVEKQKDSLLTTLIASTLAGKSKGRTASSALNQLLTKEPLANEGMIYPLKALMALSAVVPAAAHAIVQKFSSFSGLYEFLEEPFKSKQEKIELLGNMISSNGRRVLLERPTIPLYCDLLFFLFSL